MKYLVELLNFDGDWVLYHIADTEFSALAAKCYLLQHNYDEREIRITQNKP